MRAALASLLLLASSAFGGDALTGPDRVRYGRSIILKVSADKAGKDFAWQVQPLSVQWVSGENRDGAFIILLDVESQAFVSFASFDAKVHDARLIVVEGEAPPNPSPPSPPHPDPSPSPPSPAPDGRFGLGNSARAWMVAYVDALHRDKSTALANSFSSMAAAIAAGTLSKPQDILSQTRASNNEALGASVDAWKKWGECLSDALSLLHETGKLKTPEDYRVAWEEIAAGLRGAK